MANEIYEDLRLTAVERPGDITLPSLVVSKVLSQQLSDIGMSGEKLKSEITNTFVLRERNASDPQYSLDLLKESKTDILSLYLRNQSHQSEIRHASILRRKPMRQSSGSSPKLVCEIAFQEWTSDGKMRAPSFLGLRDDKEPKDVVRES
jgi:hypothetical protein